jgi:phosphodiesterase/alkaline phosphatase D-like protein
VIRIVGQGISIAAVAVTLCATLVAAHPGPRTGALDASAAQAGPFVVPEILGRPTDHSVTVNIVPGEELEAYVEYGPAPSAYTGRTQTATLPGGAPSEIVLDGLAPDARAYYRIRYRTGGATDFAAGQEHRFHTRRTAGSIFTFDIQGDSHPERLGKQFDPGLYARTLANAAADRPDFYVMIGDDFSVDTLKDLRADTVTALYIDQRRYLGSLGASAPVFLVNGNHEQAALANLDGTSDNVAVWAQTARNAFFPQPAPDGFYTGDAEPVAHIGLLRDYYAFTWGDALFVVIDPYWHSPEPVDKGFGEDRDERPKRDLWKVTLGEAQYRWFERTLATSTAHHKFVFAHHVNGTGRGGTELAYTYEWGNAGEYPARRPGWERPIHQLMADNHVSIFFQGHDHIFVRQALDGVTYQTLPEPAHPFYTLENADAFKSGDALPNSGHVRVTVSPDAVTVDYVRSFLAADEIDGHRNGEVAFSYTLRNDEVPEDDPHRILLPVGLADASLGREVPAVAGRTPSQRATPTTAAPPTVPPSPLPQTSAVPTAPPPPVAPPGRPFPGTVILGSPTDRSVVASLLSDVGGDAFVEYGARPGEYTGRTAVVPLTAGEPVRVDLGGLAPDTVYFYRVQSRGPGDRDFGADGEHTFHTQRRPGNPFTFTIDADPHDRDPAFDADVFRATLRNALTDDPDFHIDLGDTFMAEKIGAASQVEVDGPYREMRSFFAILAPVVPLFLVTGNHDGELGWRRDGSNENIALWATRARQRFFPTTVPGGDFYSGATAGDPGIGVRDAYYAWTWGDALFVVLDPYWYSNRRPRDAADNWNLSLGEAQYRWFKQTLEASDAPFKFVFAHNLVGGLDTNMRGGIEAADKYEWGGANADGSWGFAANRPGWPAPIHQIMVDNHVSAFFHGHDHLFVKQDLDGIVYQECPQPSYTSYDRTSSAAEYGYVHGDVLGCCGHLRVSVDPAGARVEYVRAYRPQDENARRRNGDVSYTYTIQPGPPTPVPPHDATAPR